MKRFTLALMVFAIAALAGSCADGGNTNKPANATNTANTANTNTAASAATAEADIKKLMETAAAALAKNDADAMDKIYGENYMLVNLDGSVETRAQRLDSIRSGTAKYTSFSYDEANIRVNPEATGAVVIARANIKGMMRGKPIDGYYRVTQVYSKTKDGWRQVSAQATAITAPAAPATAANSNTNAAKPPAGNNAPANTNTAANTNK